MPVAANGKLKAINGLRVNFDPTCRGLTREFFNRISAHPDLGQPKPNVVKGPNVAVALSQLALGRSL